MDYLQREITFTLIGCQSLKSESRGRWKVPPQNMIHVPDGAFCYLVHNDGLS